MNPWKMRNKAPWYRIMFIMILCSAFLSVGNPALAADKVTPVTATPALKSQFYDVPATDADAIYVNLLVGRGIVKGYPDGGYHPNEGLTRAQAATVIVKAAGLSVDSDLTTLFSDVDNNHWAKAYIATAAKAGYISGLPDGSYHPDEQLTRAQAISLILHLSKQPLTGVKLPATLTDIDSTHWAAPYVAIGIASGMVGISSDGKQYLPDAPFSRISLAHALGILLTEDPGLYAASLEGKLKTLEGSVTIQSTENQKTVEVKSETVVKAGYIIKTGAKSSAEIDYPDGSSLLLKEDTQITVVETKGRKYLKADGSEGTAVDWLDIKLKQGTILGGLAAKHETSSGNKTTGLLADGTLPWYAASQQKKVKIQVDMPSGVAAIRGTFWYNFANANGQSSTAVLTGDAEVTSGGQTVSLTGNQSTTVTQAGTVPSPAPMPPATLQQFVQAQTWMTQTAQTMDQNREATPPPPPAATLPGQVSPLVNPPTPPLSVVEIISQAVQTAESNPGTTNTSNNGGSRSSVTLQSLAIIHSATKLSYFIGETLSIGGLVVTGTYSDSSTQIEAITTADVSGFDSTVPAVDQVLTITVEGKTTTYKVQIIAAPITQIPFATGWSTTYALSSDGKVWGWGNNIYGQVGNNNNNEQHLPVDISTNIGSDVMVMDGGEGSGYALKSDGTVLAWGRNDSGQLGNGSTTDSLTPVTVTGLSSVTSIANWWHTAYAVESNGTLWGWGENSAGQLGSGTVGNSSVPVQITGLSNVKSVACIPASGVSKADTYILKNDGTVWDWGDNAYGQLGDGTIIDRADPVKVQGLSGVIHIACMGGTGYALKADGSVWAWGRNNFGQLGNNDTTDSSVPVQVHNLSGIIDIAGGDCCGYALKPDNTVWSWGWNGNGVLGDNTTTDRHEPVQVSGLVNVVAIDGGRDSGYAIKTDGTIWSWGSNGAGELGDNTTTNRLAPVQVVGLNPVTPLVNAATPSCYK